MTDLAPKVTFTIEMDDEEEENEETYTGMTIQARVNGVSYWIKERDMVRCDDEEQLCEEKVGTSKFRPIDVKPGDASLLPFVFGGVKYFVRKSTLDNAKRLCKFNDVCIWRKFCFLFCLNVSFCCCC